MVEEWSTLLIQSLQDVFGKFLTEFLPKLIVAIIVFVFGWFVAIGVGKLIAEILKRLGLDKVFGRTGWREALEKAEIKVYPSEFIGAIFKWVLVIAFLVAAVEILGLTQFAVLLNKIVSWLPNLIVAVIIFFVAIIIADILQKIIKVSVQKIGIKYAGILGGITRWGIYIIAIFAILVQLGIAPALINALIFGFVGMLSLAFGLAFGLGGKDAAAKIIEDLRKKISE